MTVGMARVEGAAEGERVEEGFAEMVTVVELPSTKVEEGGALSGSEKAVSASAVAVTVTAARAVHNKEALMVVTLELTNETWVRRKKKKKERKGGNLGGFYNFHRSGSRQRVLCAAELDIHAYSLLFLELSFTLNADWRGGGA
jgi:hypothetical protein